MKNLMSSKRRAPKKEEKNETTSWVVNKIERNEQEARKRQRKKEVKE